MDYQHPQGYTTRPPPPPAADPYQRLPPPQPPNQPWPYPSPQFQYQPQTQHSPSPPPPHWPPPHSSEHAPPYPSHPPPYPPHQPPSYTAHPHYPPSYPLPPRPPPQSYAQARGSGSWSHQQSWQYPTNNSEEDWGAKAKAWLAAKVATENQHPSSQFAPSGRPEENNHFRDQYYQPNDPQVYDVATPLPPSSNYQQYPGSAGPPNRTGLGQFQDSQYINSGQSSCAADMHEPFAARDGSLAGDPLAPSNPLIQQQEVPSSYSSVSGNEEAGDAEKFNSSSSLHVAPLSQHHVQTLPHGGGRSGWMEGPHNFGVPVRGGEPSNYAWTHTMSQGAVYPPGPPPIHPGVQADHPIAMPSPTVFSSGSSFQSTVPMMGAAFGVGAGVTPPTAFSGDAYGFSERPKKASVPNWLREEIIKNKAVIASSVPEIPKEESQSIEEDSIDNSSRKGYQVDSKITDSFRSSEDEDEDEDEVEAARTLAINQEIKRVLTEVLLKVTDELFDEVATKVINEDDLSVNVGRDVDSSNHEIPTQSVLTPKASAKVLVSIKTKENDYKDPSEKSTSAPTGDVLGLGSYASDEEDDEIQSPIKLNLKESSSHEQPSSSKLSEVNWINENGASSDAKEHRPFPAKMEIDGTGGKSPMNANMSLSDDKADGDLASSADPRPSKRLSRITENELLDGPDVSRLKKSAVEKVVERNDHISNAGRLINDDSGIQETGNRFERNERLENKMSSVMRDHKDSENLQERLDKKAGEEHGRLSRTERINYHDNSTDKGKEKRTDERVKNTESRKRVSPGGEEGTNETHRDKRDRGKENDNEKRQGRTGDEKRERYGHKSESESSRHKRRRSSSRGKGSKNKSVVSWANDSSDESSDDSRRKSHHSKRRRSPSPVRTRKRQVSPSPHSKHSKLRHSSYSSLDTNRGKRSASKSRSRSPAHRRR